jgi:hypothetical protein
MVFQQEQLVPLQSARVPEQPVDQLQIELVAQANQERMHLLVDLPSQTEPPTLKVVLRLGHIEQHVGQH